MEKPTTAVDPSDYLRMRKRYESERPTRIIVLSSGAPFEVYKISTLEALSILEVIGLKTEDLTRGNDLAMGAALFDNFAQVVDQFLPRFVKKPALVPSDETPDEDQLSVKDLHKDDQWLLVQEIMKSATGQGDDKQDESFPDRDPGQGS